MSAPAASDSCFAPVSHPRVRERLTVAQLGPHRIGVAERAVAGLDDPVYERNRDVWERVPRGQAKVFDMTNAPAAPAGSSPAAIARRGRFVATLVGLRKFGYGDSHYGAPASAVKSLIALEKENGECGHIAAFAIAGGKGAASRFWIIGSKHVHLVTRFDVSEADLFAWGADDPSQRQRYTYAIKIARQWRETLRALPPGKADAFHAALSAEQASHAAAVAAGQPGSGGLTASFEAIFSDSQHIVDYGGVTMLRFFALARDNTGAVAVPSSNPNRTIVDAAASPPLCEPVLPALRFLASFGLQTVTVRGPVDVGSAEHATLLAAIARSENSEGCVMYGSAADAASVIASAAVAAGEDESPTPPSSTASCAAGAAAPPSSNSVAAAAATVLRIHKEKSFPYVMERICREAICRGLVGEALAAQLRRRLAQQDAAVREHFAGWTATRMPFLIEFASWLHMRGHLGGGSSAAVNESGGAAAAAAPTVGAAPGGKRGGRGSTRGGRGGGRGGRGGDAAAGSDAPDEAALGGGGGAAAAAASTGDKNWLWSVRNNWVSLQAAFHHASPAERELARKWSPQQTAGGSGTFAARSTPPPDVVMCVGLPGSGKSSFARGLQTLLSTVGVERVLWVNQDESGGRPQFLQTLRRAAADPLTTHIIIDKVNLDARMRDDYRREAGLDVTIAASWAHHDGDAALLRTCVERVVRRGAAHRTLRVDAAAAAAATGVSEAEALAAERARVADILVRMQRALHAPDESEGYAAVLRFDVEGDVAESVAAAYEALATHGSHPLPALPTNYFLPDEEEAGSSQQPASAAPASASAAGEDESVTAAAAAVVAAVPAGFASAADDVAKPTTTTKPTLQQLAREAVRIANAYEQLLAVMPQRFQFACIEIVDVTAEQLCATAAGSSSSGGKAAAVGLVPAVAMGNGKVPKKEPLHVTTKYFGGAVDPAFFVLTARLMQSGAPVALQVLEVVYDERAVALVIGGDFRCANRVPHATVALGPGVAPVYSNDLLQSPKAVRVPVRGVTLRGVYRLK